MLSVLLVSLVACTSPEALSPEAQRGKDVYQANCMACHNADPAKTGPVGPAVRGASRALLEARILRAGYPEGYTPLRDTTSMVALPHLAANVDDLAAYLR